MNLLWDLIFRRWMDNDTFEKWYYRVGYGLLFTALAVALAAAGIAWVLG